MVDADKGEFKLTFTDYENPAPARVNANTQAPKYKRQQLTFICPGGSMSDCDKSADEEQNGSLRRSKTGTLASEAVDSSSEGRPHEVEPYLAPNDGNNNARRKRKERNVEGETGKKKRGRGCKRRSERRRLW